MPKRDGVQEMRQEVSRLRKEGWAFSKVARKLAISKSYAVKLANAQAEPAPPEDTGTSTALTVRERRFAAGLLGGKNQRQAAIEAGAPPGGADAFANRTLRDLKFQGAFQEMLAQAGLSEEAIVRVHAANLAAPKVVAYATKDGRIALLHRAIIVLRGFLAIEPHLLRHRRNWEPRILTVPALHMDLGDCRFIQRVKTVRVERSKVVGVYREPPPCQLGRRCSGEACSQHGVGSEPVHGAPDLAGEIRRFPRPWWAEDPVFGGDGVVPQTDAFEPLCVARSSIAVTGSFAFWRQVILRVKILKWQFPAALFPNLAPAHPDRLGSDGGQHRPYVSHRQILQRGLVDVHLKVAGADSDSSFAYHRLAKVLGDLPFDRGNEGRLGEVMGDVHSSGALVLKFLAAFLLDAGVQHHLGKLFPGLRLDVT